MFKSRTITAKKNYKIQRRKEISFKRSRQIVRAFFKKSCVNASFLVIAVIKSLF